MESKPAFTARLYWTRCVKNHGAADPRTVQARRAWLTAKADAAQAEADRLRAQADALAVAS